VVYYSMRQMWRCEPLGAELARIRKLKTERERQRANFIKNVNLDMQQPVQYPIFVPSKGRWKRAQAAMMLRGCGLPFTLVVEPHEEALYREDFPTAQYLVLPERNQGIRYARQYILDYCRKQGYSRYWQIDDNIERFVYAKDGSQVPVTANAALGEIEKLVADRRSIALAATDYAQFGVLAEKDVTYGTRAYCCVLTSTETGINYRVGTDMKEDVDFILQHLAAGHTTLLSHRFAMVKPAMGKNKIGGLSAQYKAGKHNDAARFVQSLWPTQTTLVDKKGSIDVKVDWSAFRGH
jgi:hypothetical protein